MVLIPKITFVPLSDDSWPIDWQRKQFPLKPAFVMTINKSQGQTMQMAGLFLRLKMFTHGQLYVAKGQNAISLRGKQEKRVQRNEEDSAKRYSYSYIYIDGFDKSVVRLVSPDIGQRHPAEQEGELRAGY